MIHVLVTFTIKDGMMDSYLDGIKKLRPLVLAEKGCVEYTYIREIASPLRIQEPVQNNRLTLVEKWESFEALEAHGKSSHMAEYGRLLGPMRESVSARVGETA
ncbi:MAG: antibiotic biosynthesis monooxygenase [Spirochaetaceae bacterium]|jgi:quinol monooxygenase YgiN|nr:antibiotic biosynthesis monooxygenase [Spirochaetaceae bacterium]